MAASEKLILSEVNKKINPLIFFLFYEWLCIKEATEVKNKKGKESKALTYWAGSKKLQPTEFLWEAVTQEAIISPGL